MIKLSKATYARIRELIERGRWRGEDFLGCDVCRYQAPSMIEVGYTAWWLCDRHAREIGVLW